MTRFRKPDVGGTYPIDAPEDSDFFEGDTLGLQWQWNANYKEDWYRVGGGQLTLYAQASDPAAQLCDVSNLLLQKWPAPEFMITACIHLEHMADGDAAGMVSQCGHYTGLLVLKENGKFSLQQRTGHLEECDEVREDLGAVEQDVLYIRMKVKDASCVSFEAGSSEDRLAPIGRTVEAEPGRWVGVKAGLAAVHERGAERGRIQVDYFVFQPLR